MAKIKFLLTSNVEENRLGDDADAVLSAADISARVRVADVGDDEYTTSVILSTTSRKRTGFFVPFQDDLATNQRLAAAAESHSRSDFGDLNLWFRHRQDDGRTGWRRRRSLLSVYISELKRKSISDFRPRFRDEHKTDEARRTHLKQPDRRRGKSIVKVNNQFHLSSHRET